MTVVRAAIVQDYVASGLEAALAKTERLIDQAAARGATLVVFPETWIPGYPIWLDVCRDAGLWDHPPVKKVFARMADAAVDVHGATGERLGRAANAAGVTLVIGVTERVSTGAGRGTLYNALLIFGADGGLLNHHRKLVPTYTERMVWGQGDTSGLRAVDTPAGRVGGLVCWEHWMPLARQALHESGEDVHVAAWPTAHEMHLIASRHYAFEGRCYVLAAGSLMYARDLPPELEAHPDKAASPDTLVMRGGSAIIGPDGKYIVEPVYDIPTIVYADLDFDRIREESMNLDVTGHYSRPDCFAFEVTEPSRP